MKKLFTFAAAILASVAMMAAEPTYESYDWADADAVAAVLGTHDGITIQAAGLGSNGNVSGHWYMPMNQNLKNSDSSWKFFGVSSASLKIDSIAILYCVNGSTTSLTNIAWAAWGQNVEPNQYILGHGLTTGLVSKQKSWDDAIWETIDLSDIEAYSVYIARSIREFREIGATSNIPNFGGGQTFNILGIRVWLEETPAATYSVTYYANNGTDESAEAPEAKKVAGCMFDAPEGMKFAGWNTAADGTGEDYAEGDKLESDLNLYAQWAEVCYEVVYDLINGVGSAEATVADAEVVDGTLVMRNTAGRITLTPAAGNVFKNGDIIEMEGTVGNSSKAFGVKIGSQAIQTTDVTPNDPEDATKGGTAAVNGVLSLSADAETIAIGRADGTTTILTKCVIKREAECGGGETAIENAEEAVKAVKFFQNGQLFIEMNGVIYNAQGAIVK